MVEKKASSLEELCTFEGFKKVWKHYGYDSDIQEMRDEEFSRIKGITYLDHAGTTLFSQSQIEGFSRDLAENVYGNPHSHNLSSRLTHDTVEHVRFRILQHFNVSPEEYTVIFTSGCTAAIKMVAESFPWRPATLEEPGSRFCYLTDNHTSIVGIRGVTSQLGVTTIAVKPDELSASTQSTESNSGPSFEETPHLFSYPAQSNFSGMKYPLRWIHQIQTQKLYPSHGTAGRWFVLLDAACFVGCSPLDLQAYPADFVPISFYKIFGFPTGLGALLVRNDSSSIMRKNYFGGGTAAAYLVGEHFFVSRTSISSRFEDGTIPFLDIIALNHGFHALERLTKGMKNIKLHTFGLARYTYMILSTLQHANGKPVARIYSDTEFCDPSTQGAIINFNVLDNNGDIIGYSQVDKLASLYNIQVRTGCFCNTGACQHHLGLSNEEMKRNLQAGHVCGDNIDIIEGRPTGSVRVSFGYMSTFEDTQAFLKFIIDSFVRAPARLDECRLARLRESAAAETTEPPIPQSGELGPEPNLEDQDPIHGADLKKPDFDSVTNGHFDAGIQSMKSIDVAGTLTNIFLYPIKSCAAFEVKHWPIGSKGLLYDRTWMVVNLNNVCLSQKQEPRLCLIQPQIDLERNTLAIGAKGMSTVSIPVESGGGEQQTQTLCQSKVCGDRVKTFDCGDEVADWISKFLGRHCRLIRQSSDFTRDVKKRHLQGQAWVSASLSLVNEAQYLMVNRTSILHLQEEIQKRNDASTLQFNTEHLIGRFRANLVVCGTQPFEEDGWTELKIGHTSFQVVGQCGRCQMIGIDQDTGTRSKEPLQTLSACRRGKVTFGAYLLHQPSETSSYPITISTGSWISAIAKREGSDPTAENQSG
ncbi:molybdenum cofactor sulfurase-like [Acipenser oxyrinchus oxyrinchus]|uniref:Molybdenum cofactor sulfurase n=1 Tax=Acipenser oxyrinchus oxyrinchus TaxID=40147 RepID=A0AAD8GDC0_ACIOX|nr:molybdenum cofactor sulfurase-like [Acipenser oxyrinchus oxyrinchus]